MRESNLYIIQDRDKFASLESLQIDYFIDDRIDVVQKILEETDRRDLLPPATRTGLYSGPLLCVLVPTVRADNLVDPIERYRNQVAQRPDGRVALAASLTDAATRVLAHSVSESRWLRAEG